MLINKMCLKCNKEFLARHDRPGLYCSCACSSSCKVQTKKRLMKECLVCGAAFEIKKYRENSALYCSVECRKKMMPKKESHPNWKGGVSRSWSSKSMIKRIVNEKGRCELCGSNNKLQGHHVMAYAETKELREDENNIQVLCVLCHSKKHPSIAKFILKGEVYE